MKTNIKNIEAKVIIFLITSVYLLTVLFATSILNKPNFKNKLIHIDSKVVGSRWVYYDFK